MDVNLPLVCFPLELSARAEITLPSVERDWLMAAPSFKRSPVAPVLSARSLKLQCHPYIIFSQNDTQNGIY